MIASLHKALNEPMTGYVVLFLLAWFLGGAVFVVLAMYWIYRAIRKSVGSGARYVAFEPSGSLRVISSA